MSYNVTEPRAGFVPPDDNRLRIARERAGLSLNQAAHMLRIDHLDLVRLECATVESVRAFVVERSQFISLDAFVAAYGVRVEWLLGEVERYDYSSIGNINGADQLTDHDRDAIAEFAASMPRDNRTAAERMACVRSKRGAP